MSKLVSLKDTLKKTVEGSLTQGQGTQNPLSSFALSPEFFIDTLKIYLQYKHAKDKIESTTKIELDRIKDEHKEIMETLHQNFRERTDSLEQAKELIREGIKRSDEMLINQGIAILKELITNPLKRG